MRYFTPGRVRRIARGAAATALAAGGVTGLSAVSTAPPAAAADSGEPYNVGTFEPGKESGNPPPRPAGALSAYASRIQDYCVKRDFGCQGSTGNFAAHLEYFVNGMPSQGVEFAVSKVRAAG